MESPYNGGHKASARHLMPTSKTSRVRNGLHLLVSLIKGVP